MKQFEIIWSDHVANEYRYYVCYRYKIIYSIDSKSKFIKIADVFDCRQNPAKIRRNK